MSYHKSLHVVGWRGITHSFCIVNQYQLYYLLKTDLKLTHCDAPFPNPAWSIEKSSSGFPKEMQEAIDQIPGLSSNEVVDFIYTIYYPLELFRRKARHTFVFSVNEYQELSTKTLDGDFYNAQDRDDVTIVTPSHWSKVGYLKAGFRDEQIRVVPHGFDSKIFRPSPVPKSELKQKLGFNDDDFLIGSAGTMTFNKGVDILLRAFHHLSQKSKKTHLILKDASSLGYVNAASVVRDFIASSGLFFSTSQLSRIHCISENLSQEQMASLFQTIDVYVSPYRAEGFGLTPLEAAGCGTPIVVTKGGSTSEYARDVGAFEITAEQRSLGDKTHLEPNIEELCSILDSVRKSRERLDDESQSKAAPPNWAWSNVVANRFLPIFS